MTNEQIREWLATEETATPGPWEYLPEGRTGGNPSPLLVGHENTTIVRCVFGHSFYYANNFPFIAIARNNFRALCEEVLRLREEVSEHDFGFDLRWEADMRAIKRWQAAHPEKPNTWPDHADLVVWLMGEVDKTLKSE